MKKEKEKKLIVYYNLTNHIFYLNNYSLELIDGKIMRFSDKLKSNDYIDIEKPGIFDDIPLIFKTQIKEYLLLSCVLLLYYSATLPESVEPTIFGNIYNKALFLPSKNKKIKEDKRRFLKERKERKKYETENSEELKQKYKKEDEEIKNFLETTKLLDKNSKKIIDSILAKINPKLSSPGSCLLHRNFFYQTMNEQILSFAKIFFIINRIEINQLSLNEIRFLNSIKSFVFISDDKNKE